MFDIRFGRKVSKIFTERKIGRSYFPDGRYSNLALTIFVLEPHQYSYQLQAGDHYTCS